MTQMIETAFKELISALQTARLYPEWHPEFKKGIEKSYGSLKEVLAERAELTVGIVGEELAFEKEVFFDLSKLLRQMIIYLKERGIERIQILGGLDKEELSKFISLLASYKEEESKKEDDKHKLQQSLELAGISNIIVGKIKVSSKGLGANDSAGILNRPLNIYQDSTTTIADSIDRMLDGQDFDYLNLKLTVKNVMENLLGMHQDFLNLASVKRYDIKTFYHILNVSILSMYFSAKLGFAKDEVLEIGTAALFHDIGKLYISRTIIRKPGKLTDEEFDKIRSHVFVGGEILLKHVDNLGMLPVIVCFEHHLKYNLKGYPKVSFYGKLHAASMIVALCDVYDALSQKRSYKNDYPPNVIYELMIREKGTSFDPELIDRFFRIMGVWPLGTLVLLSDKRVAVVRKEHEDDIFSPEVEVIFPQDKKEAIDLRAENESRIECFLNPFREGKRYLNLIYPDQQKGIGQ